LQRLLPLDVFRFAWNVVYSVSGRGAGAGMRPKPGYIRPSRRFGWPCAKHYTLRHINKIKEKRRPGGDKPFHSVCL